MGEDIHFRCYLKSRKNGQYINAHEVCSWQGDATIFSNPVSVRNYNLFSLFGSRRGEYEELNYANYGMPEFLNNSEFNEYCRNCGYYGFIWFTLIDLKRAVNEYYDKLIDPAKWLDPDSDLYSDWIDFIQTKNDDKDFTQKLMVKYKMWLDEHYYILNWLEQTSETLNNYSEQYYVDIYSKQFDLDQTIFLFFFDS